VAVARIASLLPSATEIVCGLGLDDRLVGVSHECDFPPAIVGRPVLTQPKLDPSRTSAAIDAEVRRLVADGASVYRVKVEELERLRPELIVTQDQCDVCAVSLADVEAAVRQCLDASVMIVSLRPERLGDILSDIQRVADATGVPAAGRHLTAAMEARFDRLRARHAHLHSRPRVACIEWIEPLMVAGNWVPELVALAGGRYDLVEPAAASRAITWEELIASAPDVVIVMPCGFRLPQTRAELPRLLAQPEWSQLPAVQNRRVYAVDGNAYLNRPGPRIAASAELLAGLIQPGFFATLIPEGSCEQVGAGS
jgi:iron complex transport system substrate-binding protein